jgi:hypothetical protein
MGTNNPGLSDMINVLLWFVSASNSVPTLDQVGSVAMNSICIESSLGTKASASTMWLRILATSGKRLGSQASVKNKMIHESLLGKSFQTRSST